MALVLVKFEGGPLTGLRLPVDHTATEYRHVVDEPETDWGGSAAVSARRVVHVYRRSSWNAFTWDHEAADDAGGWQ